MSVLLDLPDTVKRVTGRPRHDRTDRVKRLLQAAEWHALAKMQQREHRKLKQRSPNEYRKATVEYRQLSGSGQTTPLARAYVDIGRVFGKSSSSIRDAILDLQAEFRTNRINLFPTLKDARTYLTENGKLWWATNNLPMVLGDIFRVTGATK